MRIIISTLIALSTFIIMPVASSRPACTINGTPHSDFLDGTPMRDRICGRGGMDFETGMERRDVLTGGPNRDTLVGGDGHDHLIGRGGDDKLFAIDGRGGDVLHGGKGFDSCYGEKSDHYFSCDRRFTNQSPTYPYAAVIALSNSLSRSISAAHHQICAVKVLPICVKFQEG